jgi:hypothetical protein
MENQPEILGARRRLIWRIVLATGGGISIAVIGTAIWAWSKHFAWLQNGDYSRNSFPMRSFALTMTWTAAFMTVAVALSWYATRRYLR